MLPPEIQQADDQLLYRVTLFLLLMIIFALFMRWR